MVMRFLSSALLAGAAAVLLGSSGNALAQNANMHRMTVQLPGGGVAEIQYTGNVPPQVTVRSGPAATSAFFQGASPLGATSPFATLDRMAAEMDREAAALLRYTDVMAAQPWPALGGLTLTNAQNLPPGTSGYSYVATLSGNGVCTRSTEITAAGNGPPRVVTHNSGNCGPDASVPAGNTGWSAPGIVLVPGAPPPIKRPDLLWTKNETAPQLYVTLLRDAAAR
jgi:hypothetical protein